MTLPKILAFVTITLFTTIAVLAFFKEGKEDSLKGNNDLSFYRQPIIIDLGKEVVPLQKMPMAEKALTSLDKVALEVPSKSIAIDPPVEKPVVKSERPEAPLPEGDCLQQLFNVGEPKLPIVETIVYKSHVPWHKGRSAWLSDYAAHYKTSCHFIGRSLNGKPDYFKQNVANGDRFNVFRKDKNINFYLLVDLSRCKMWFYYIDLDTKEQVLLKTYTVGVGRESPEKESGFLTPIGKYSLGNKVAIYLPKAQGHHNGKKVEMVSVFGTRWIPFEKEISNCSAPAKGFGIHGVPLVSGNRGVITQDTSSLGKYESDGCIRLASADIEEIYAIVITKPTFIEIVKDFYDAKLP